MGTSVLLTATNEQIHYKIEKNYIIKKSKVMSKSFLFRALMLATALVSFNFSAVPGVDSELPPQLVVLRAGTAVSVQLNDEISSDNVEVGNAVEFTVRSNVTVNGKVLIAAGSIAEGWVKDVQKTCEGCKKKDRCGKLVITVENVQSVDGQRVNLRSIPHTVKGNCCCGGGPAVAKFGTVLSARVVNDIKIDA